MLRTALFVHAHLANQSIICAYAYIQSVRSAHILADLPVFHYFCDCFLPIISERQPANSSAASAVFNPSYLEDSLQILVLLAHIQYLVEASFCT